MRIVDPLIELKAYVAQFSTQKDAAKALDISEPYLCDILYERRPVSDTILEKIGLSKRVVVKE